MLQEQKIILMNWDKFVTVVTFPFKMIFSLLNVLDAVQIAPGISIVDIMIFGIISLITAGFIIRMARGE